MQLLSLGARMLQLPVKAASGCWMCREGSPLTRLLRDQLLEQQLMRGKALVLEQPLRPQELQNSLELVPVQRLLRLSLIHI